MSDQVGILPKWLSNWGITLTKGQLDNSYTFWTMPILLFSPVQIIMRHPLLVVHVIQQLIPIFIGLFFEPFKQSSKVHTPTLLLIIKNQTKLDRCFHFNVS